MGECVAVCCSVSQCVAVCCSVLQCVSVNELVSVLQCVAVCCSVLQCVAVCSSVCCVLQCVAVCCSVLQCVAVCCRVLQCVSVNELVIVAGEILTCANTICMYTYIYIHICIYIPHACQYVSTENVTYVYESSLCMYMRNTFSEICISYTFNKELYVYESSQCMCMRNLYFPNMYCPYNRVAHVYESSPHVYIYMRNKYF